MSLLNEHERWLVKSLPKKLARRAPWIVDTIYSNVDTGMFVEVPFGLMNLRRIRQPKAVGPNGVLMKARKFREYKLIRMPRQTPTPTPATAQQEGNE